VYSTGRVLTFLKHLGFFDFPIIKRGSFSEPLLFLPIVEAVNCGGQHTDKSRDKGRTINYPGFSITQVPINQVPL
jgi:hypothetical protein